MPSSDIADIGSHTLTLTETYLEGGSASYTVYVIFESPCSPYLLAPLTPTAYTLVLGSGAQTYQNPGFTEKQWSDFVSANTCRDPVVTLIEMDSISNVASQSWLTVAPLNGPETAAFEGTA